MNIIPFKIVSYCYTNVFPAQLQGYLVMSLMIIAWISISDPADIHYMTLDELLSCSCFMYHPSAFYTWDI